MEEKMIQNVAEDSANAVPVTSMVSPGLDPKDPAAIEAMNNSLRLRGRDVLRAGVMGAAAGSQVGQQAGDPRSAFIQGMAAGMGATDTVFRERKQELQTAADMVPFGSTHPEIVNSNPAYAIFKGLPTKLALQAIQQIGVDAAKIQAESTAKIAEQTSANDLSTIKTIEEAIPYARLANQSYGLSNNSAIKPEELIGMKASDVDNMIRTHVTGNAPMEVNVQLTEPMESAPGGLAGQYGLPSQRVNPYYNMPEKVYEKVRAANSVLANKTIEKAQGTVDGMANAINGIQRAKSLLDSGLQTGPISGRVPGRTLGAEAQEFEQIAATILPSMRQGMPGAVSDRDMAIFRDANFGLTKDEKVNRKILNQQMAVATRVKDKAEFLSNWATVYGDMSGAEANWAKYVKENSLFTATGDINPNVQPPATYFDKVSGRSANAWTPEKEAKLNELRAKVGNK